MTKKEITILKAIAICYKPYLKPEEAMIYCNLGSTQLLVKTRALGIYKNTSGYYKKEDLDMMMSGMTNLAQKINEK